MRMIFDACSIVDCIFPIHSLLISEELMKRFLNSLLIVLPLFLLHGCIAPPPQYPLTVDHTQYNQEKAREQLCVSLQFPFDEREHRILYDQYKTSSPGIRTLQATSEMETANNGQDLLFHSPWDSTRGFTLLMIKTSGGNPSITTYMEDNIPHAKLTDIEMVIGQAHEFSKVGESWLIRWGINPASTREYQQAWTQLFNEHDGLPFKDNNQLTFFVSTMLSAFPNVTYAGTVPPPPVEQQ